MNKYKHITKEQRIQIGVLLRIGISKRKIAEQVGVHRVTLQRELRRNANKRGGYNAGAAQLLAQERKERFGRARKFTGAMKKFIDSKLSGEQWSPEQISGYCEVRQIPMVSHECIYQYIYQERKKGGTLYKHLRVASQPYRKHYGKRDYRGKISGRVSIDHRPAVVEERRRIGDWEADTIVGVNRKSALLTLTERKSKFALLVPLKTLCAQETRKAMINALAPYKSAVHTITTDNGKEFTEHQTIAEKLQADYYFTHPYSAWEKGTNENTNGLIRQYFPKKADLKNISCEQIVDVTNKLNNRPRKSLGYQTPQHVFIHNIVKLSSVALGT